MNNIAHARTVNTKYTFQLPHNLPDLRLSHLPICKHPRKLSLSYGLLNPLILPAEVYIELRPNLTHLLETPLEDPLAKELALVPTVYVVEEFADQVGFGFADGVQFGGDRDLLEKQRGQQRQVLRVEVW